MGKHIDGRHLGCSRTRLSSRSGAGSGPGAGGGRESGLLPRRARELVRETSGASWAPDWTGGALVNSECLVGLAYALARKQVRPVGSSWVHASTCVPCAVGLSSRRRGELHDGRCPSRSGRGEASAASNRDGRRREERKPARPLTRETSAGSLRSSGWARASASIRGTVSDHSTWHPDEGRPPWLGLCFGRGSDAATGCRLPTSTLECACPHGRARDGARGGQSRFRRFDRSCSWTVLIAEVDERRLAFHRMVTGLVSPWVNPLMERRTGAGSRIATAKSW